MKALNTHTVNRQQRPITILQFGCGNFLRGFADWMIDQANVAGLTDHGVAIAYATERTQPRHDPLVEQDGLFHVCLEGIKDGRPARRIDLVQAVQQIVDPYSDYDSYRRIALSPELKIIISNTTEAGITYQADDDLQASPPASFPAKVAQLLHERYLASSGSDDAGLSILCCELIEDNGATLREYVIRHAERAGWGRDFLTWLDRANHFYDSLVDRIVSGFPGPEAPALQAEIGYADAALVKGELFSLWVIGGDAHLREILPLDRLDLGVTFVDRAAVAPFRDKKVRILNGCHTAMAQLGLQLGFDTVGQAFGNPELRAFLTELIAQEVLPTIAGDPDDLRRFAAAILERFDNPYLQHHLADIGLNSISKYQARNLPVLLDRWAAGEQAHRAVLALAALLVLYSGRSAAVGFVPRDDEAAVAGIRAAFETADPTRRAELCLAAIGLGELEQSQRLAEEVGAAIELILTDGAGAAVRRLSRAAAPQPVTA